LILSAIALFRHFRLNGQRDWMRRYTFKMLGWEGSSPANVLYQGQSLARLEGITLEQGEKWEQEIGFAPQYTGDNQKVEL
jgi:hypothetical protein